MIELRLRKRAECFCVAALLVAAAAAPIGAQSAPELVVGRRLDDALRTLQATGLRIVFTSELVTPEMRVLTEPRARAAKVRLVEMLEPHDLGVREGPGGTILIVRKPSRPIDRAAPSASPTSRRHQDVPRRREREPFDGDYREQVTVTASHIVPGDVDLGSSQRLGSKALGAFGSRLTDDPLRTVQSLPGVMAGSDFRSEFSVRGSSYRHAAVVVDGAPAPWLQHVAAGRGDTGTLTMLRSDVVESATMSVGAYSRRDGGQLGPLLNVTLREGSRVARQQSVGISGTSATLTTEGPLGLSGRGSWLVATRKSLVEWPLRRSDHDATVFGFADVQSKLVYDVRPGQQVSLSLVAGVSNVERDNPNPSALADGTNRAALMIGAWRSIVGTRTMVRQQVSVLTQTFLDQDQSRRVARSGANRLGAYRLDLTRALHQGLLEAGTQTRRVGGSTSHLVLPPTNDRDTGGPTAGGLEESWWERSGYGSFRWTPMPGVTVAPGLRVADSTLAGEHAVDRWVQIEWLIAPRWRLFGSSGVAHQFPALDQVRVAAGAALLRPERARYVDLGVGHQLTPSIRANATVFMRRERDILRGPEPFLRMANGIIAADAASDDPAENALAGSAQGVDLSIERRSRSGLSGWVGYSFGVARYWDLRRLESFRGDLDQRHTVSVSAFVSLPHRARVGATLRAGTNVPIPGYLVVRDDGLFLGGQRNRAQLPAYVRFDLRAERTLDLAGRRATVFADALNLLNHANYAPVDGVVVPASGQAVGFTERLFPRLATAGLRLEF